MTDENKPLWQMTSGEFMEFLKEGLNRTVATEPVSPLANTHKKYVYGIAGIAKLLGAVFQQPIASRKAGKLTKPLHKLVERLSWMLS